MRPGAILRIEGLVVLAASLVAFHHLGVSWWLAAALVLAPDLGMLGYLAGPRTGAHLYNLTHTLTPPAVLGGIGLIAGATTVVAVALVWIAHIGMDRAVGYGLKYPGGGFRHTHLQQVA